MSASSSNSINPNHSSLNPVSQQSEPAIQPVLQDTATFEGAGLGTSGSSGQHLLRKRHSPNSSGVIGGRREDGEFGAAATAVAGDTPVFSAAQTKLRKVSASSSFRAGSSNSHHSSNHEDIANKPGSSKNSVISHRRNSQLKYLTDYFPDQSTSSGEFTRLTRSKAKATTTLPFGQTGEDESAETPSSSFHFRSSHIPISQEKHSKKLGHHQHGHFSSSTADAGVVGGHRKLGLAGAMPSSLHHHHQRSTNILPPPYGSIQPSGVLQFASTQPPPQHHRNSMPSSSSSALSANMGQQYMQSTSSLLGAPNSSMHFDLGNLSPSVIMSLPPASSSSNSQSQRHTDISNFASQLAAAVVSGAAGGVGQNVSVDVSSSASAAAIFAAAATSSAAAADYHQFLQESAAGSTGSGGGGHSSSSIGINRASNYSSLTGKPSSASSSVFGLKPQQHVNRATSFLGNLVPRMQHLLSSSGGSSSSLSMNSGTSSTAATGSGSIHIHHSSNRMHSIVEGLRSSNEIRQSEAASELAEMLLLGNEESLPNMPVRDIIQCLIVLLQKDHNFELMLTAARCITNMQEALPRALPIITEAIPLLLQKLKRIEYIDVAEQSLIALEVMSRRNAKNILLAGGIAATISHVDFFSLPSQRLAFQIAANCAIYVGANEFAFLKDCLSDLTQRLNFVDDKRCVESICTFFNRLIENVRHHPEKLREIAGANHEFLKNAQRLLTIQPSTIGSNTFLSLLKSMRYMCSKCGDIAVGLITMDIGRTIRYLLVGPEKSDDANSSSSNFDITARPAQQLREIIELIGELLPNPPNTEVFEVTTLLNHYMNSGSFPRCQYPFDVLAVNWYAINESGTEWRLLGPQETGALEQAKGSSEQMAVLQMEGDVFDVDFSRMLRRSQTTGIESALDRRITSMHNTSVPPPPLNKYGMDHNEIDDRELLKRTKNEMFLELIAMLFPLLVEVGTVSTCSSLRFDTLRVMMRMIYAVESETQLQKILSEVPLAIYISSTLSSNKSLGVLVSALQLVHILLEKIPHLYVPLLEAEGVFHEIRKLMKPIAAKPATSFASMVTSTSRRGHEHNRRQQPTLPPPPHPAPNASDLSSYLVAASSSANQQFNPMQSHLGGQQHNAYYQNHTLRSHPHLDVAASNSALQHFQQQLQMSQAQLAAAAAGGMLGGVGSQAQPTSFFNTNMMPGVINQVNNPNMPTAEMLMARAHAAFPSLSSMALPPPLPVYVPSSSTQQQHQQQMAAASDALAAAATAALVPPPPSSSTTNHMPNSSALKQAIVDKLQEFVSSESVQIIQKYTVGENAIKYGTDKGGTGDGLLELLAGIAQQLSTHHRDVGCDPLNALKKVLVEHEISAFQLNHSGITAALNTYLTDQTNVVVPPRKLRLRRFAALFMMLDADTLEPHISSKESLAPFERLVSKVLLAIGQLERFQVKITNLSGIQSGGGGGTPISHATGASGLLNASALTSTTYLRGAQALRFFQTHQIKCSLKRHPSCKQLKEWRHGRGSIKVDPFTSISAIERYLVDRGIGVANQPAEGDSSDNEDISDEEQDLSYQSSAASYNGRIELYIGEQKIPSDISILQAIRQFSLPHEEDTQETIPSSIWITAHTLYYRTAEASVASNISSTAVDPSIYIGSASASNSGASSPSTSTRSSTAAVVGGSSSRTLGATSFAPTTSSSGTAAAAVSSDNSSSRPVSSPPTRKMPRMHYKLTSSISGTAKKDKYSANVTKNNAVYRDGHPPKRECPLETYLKNELSHELNDPAVGCLILLKTLYGLNKFWWSLFDGDQDYYSPPSHSAILPLNVFHSSKLNSKVSRQLSDFLSVATQQIPKWTTDLVKAVPFAFPFITRRNLLYCTSFGRDRALMHLVNEGTGDDHDGESTSRLIPRLERRKVSINRTNLLKDAQQTLTQLGSSKAMLEVGFDGEVGTGFGPTLEFYSTLSKEIQKHSLKLWYGKAQKCAEHEMDESGDNEYTTSENGLYPCIYRPASSKQMDARLKKFEFFGRLLAQSLLDSRMLDIPIASTFFKWVIGEEHSLGLDDLEVLEPTLYKSLHNMSSMSELDFDGLDTYFLFPGENSFEMVKGGKNALVRKSNFKQFVELVCYWRLVEGVRPEMEAVRRGLQTVVNTDSLKIFFPDELEQLFCGCPESGQDDKIWSKSALQQAIRPDHGFSHDSVQIGWLVEMLNTYPNENVESSCNL